MPSILSLLVVWLGITLCVRAISSGKPSVATTLKLLDAWPAAAAANEEARREWIGLIASRLSALDLDSRHQVLMDSRLRSALTEMSNEDQTYLLQATEPPSMSVFLEGTKGWGRLRFERILPLALGDLEDLKPGSAAQAQALLANPADDAIRQAGIKAYLKNKDPITRLDAQPLIERIQKYCQLGR